MCPFEELLPVHGMIDAHAYHSSATTWPIPLAYVQINPTDKTEPILFIDNKEAMRKLKYVEGVNISYHTTTETGDFLVRLNSRMYNEEYAKNHPNFSRDFDELSQNFDGRMIREKDIKSQKTMFTLFRHDQEPVLVEWSKK
jgi:hypothetical protein